MVLVAGVWFGSAGHARAHAFQPGVLALTETAPDRYAVTWRRPSAATDAAGVRPVFPPECQALGAPVPYGVGGERWEVECRGGGLRGARLRVAGLAAIRAEVAVRIVWRVGEPFTALLRPDAAATMVPRTAPAPGTWVVGTAAAYIGLGVAHIWAGADHLAFVAGLCLLAPAARTLLATITAFTVAHSVSLALAVLDVVRVPAAPVEAVIALSVLLLMGEIARGDTGSLTRRAPWLMAGGFGLVHGLGFAGALREIGLPDGRAAVALAGFNLGVEAGQIAFVALMAMLAVTVRPIARRWPGAGRVPVYAMGTAAAVWTLERVAAALGGPPAF